MDIDLDLYRHEVRVSTNPLVHGTASLVRLRAIDISPDHPQQAKEEAFMGPILFFTLSPHLHL
jgi:hypothetical protein